MTLGVGVVGGGILGIAIARELVRRGISDVTVLEKEDRLARHQTGHNSGVVHAGIYYPPGSLKASLCARGRGLLRDFALERDIPYRETGKLVVAVDDTELPALAEIERRARASRVPGLTRIDDPARMREIEPHVAGISAVHSPRTAVVSFAAVTEALADDVRDAGGRIETAQEVVAVSVEGDRGVVRTRTTEYDFSHIVVCAGLQSDVIARMIGADPSPRILPFRGEYWHLSPEGADLVRGMIYPVPDPRFPFLGVHFTRGIDDTVHMGPNAVPALAREGYRWRDVSIRDVWESLRWPGAIHFARQHWRMGVHEISGSLSKEISFRRARRFVPELRRRDLVAKRGAGVRAQAWASDGKLLDDFSVQRVGPVTLLRNAPSPAATSALAIAEHVLDHYVGDL